MDQGLAVVLAAVVTGVLAIVKVLVTIRREGRATRRENRDDHALVIHELRSLRDSVDDLRVHQRAMERKHDRHIDWHMEREEDGQTTRRNRRGAPRKAAE